MKIEVHFHAENMEQEVDWAQSVIQTGRVERVDIHSYGLSRQDLSRLRVWMAEGVFGLCEMRLFRHLRTAWVHRPLVSGSGSAEAVAGNAVRIAAAGWPKC